MALNVWTKVVKTVQSKVCLLVRGGTCLKVTKEIYIWFLSNSVEYFEN